MLAALALSALSRERGIANLVLSGIVVNALAQAVLMLMKLTADPEKELASIEFWIMGSFADVTLDKTLGAAPWILLGLAGLVLLRRQILLLGLEEEEARTLGVPVGAVRTGVLLLATLVTGAVISVTGLISFVGLLAPTPPVCLPGAAAFPPRCCPDCAEAFCCCWPTCWPGAWAIQKSPSASLPPFWERPVSFG